MRPNSCLFCGRAWPFLVRHRCIWCRDVVIDLKPLIRAAERGTQAFQAFNERLFEMTETLKVAGMMFRELGHDWEMTWG